MQNLLDLVLQPYTPQHPAADFHAPIDILNEKRVAGWMTPGSEDEEAEEQPQAMRYRHLHAHENDALGSEMRAELKAGNRGFKSWSNRSANCIC